MTDISGEGRSRGQSLRAHLGRRIREIRMNAGLSIVELAGLLGIESTMVNDIENGQAEPDLDVVDRLCEVLDVSPEWFFNDFDNIGEVASFSDLVERHISLSKSLLDAYETDNRQELKRLGSSLEELEAQLLEFPTSSSQERIDKLRVLLSFLLLEADSQPHLMRLVELALGEVGKLSAEKSIDRSSASQTA